MLPMALGFLMLFAVLIGLIFTYINTGMAASTSLQTERNDVAAVNGAVDAAINRVRNDSSLGTDGGATACGLQGVPVNDASINVTCMPTTGSGEPIPTTAAPPFAILTMSPFITLSPATWSGNTPPNCVNVPTPEPPNELGVVQVQDSKLVTVTGNVYVNADADSDVWSGGCPQTTTAQHILVNGNVKQRASCHDIDPVLDSYTWICGNGTATPQTPANPDGPLGGAPDADLNDPAIAQPNSWALPFTNPPAVQSVPSCPAGNVVAFNPGTYTDAAALTTLMNGVTCPGRIFWFKPGQYYFNFTNGTGAGTDHEWSINDGRAKVIAGQPTAVTTGGTLVGPTRWAATTATGTSGFSTPSNAIDIGGATSDVQLGTISTTTGPTTWSASGASSSTFSSPTNAIAIDGTNVASATFTAPTTATLSASSPPAPTTSSPGFATTNGAITINDGTTSATGNFNGSNATRWVTVGGYTTGQVPPGATNIQLQARVRHQESTTGSTISSLQVQVRNAADTATLCTLNVDKSTSMVTALAPSGGPTTCAGLSQNDLNTGNFRLRYQVQHSSNNSTTNVSTTLDGIQLLVTYASGPTSGSVSLTGFSGGGTIPAGATINSITMSVAHNEGTTSTSIVNAPTVTLPGCTQTLNRRASLTTDAVTLPAGCLSVAQLNGGPTLTFNAGLATGSSSNATVSLDGITLAVTYTVTTNGSSGTQSVTLSGYATNPATTIPDDATITSVRLRVAHGEDNPALVNNPTVVVTPANSPACSAVTINKHTGVSEDAAPSYDITNCFTLPAQINNGVSVKYNIAHCSGSANGCTTAGTIDHLDGIWLDVSYVSNPRLPWDPNDPNANPNVPGACRHDGDPFWTDGVQWVFGGDSRINLKSGQMELCDKPSLRHADPSQDQQEIVLYGVKAAGTGTSQGWVAGSASPAVTGTCPTTTTAANPTTFCQSASALAIGGSSSSALFSGTGTLSRTITLAGGWTGPALPGGATVTSVTARVAHRETSNALVPATSGGWGGSVQLTASATGCGPSTSTLAPNTGGSVATTFVTLPGCINASNLNSLSLAYKANYACTGTSPQSPCPSTAAPASSILDGIVLDVSYSLGSATGNLNPQSGCITQIPYYSPVDHSPNYDNDGAGPSPAACALIKITRPPLSQTPPPGDIRKLTLWGTAYAPSSAFDLPVDLLPVPVFNRGVVARMLMMGYQVANSTQVPFTTTPLAGSTPTNRVVNFTADVPGRSTEVTANVEFCDNGCSGAPPATQGSPVGVVVHSWKVRR
ncbi:MAG TPA: hypothetical protein VH986_06605 [Acidimicrobiia bacterium]